MLLFGVVLIFVDASFVGCEQNAIDSAAIEQARAGLIDSVPVGARCRHKRGEPRALWKGCRKSEAPSGNGVDAVFRGRSLVLTERVWSGHRRPDVCARGLACAHRKFRQRARSVPFSVSSCSDNAATTDVNGEPGNIVINCHRPTSSLRPHCGNNCAERFICNSAKMRADFAERFIARS